MIRNIVFCASSIAAAFFAAAAVQAADFWVDRNSGAAMIDSDSGVVTGIWGQASVRKSFMTQNSEEIPLGVFDKMQAGDIVETGREGRVEITSGNNVLLVIGPESAVRFLGLVSFFTSENAPAKRLDLQMLKGRIRLQVRLNRNYPEMALVEAGSLSVLTTRGDMSLFQDPNWRLAVLVGDVSYRNRPGGTLGPVAALQAGQTLYADNIVTLTDEEKERLATAMPFRYEIGRAALPPAPPPGPDGEAP